MKILYTRGIIFSHPNEQREDIHQHLFHLNLEMYKAGQKRPEKKIITFRSKEKSDRGEFYPSACAYGLKIIKK